MRTALRLFAIITSIFLATLLTNAQESKFNGSHIIGQKLLTPEGVLVSSSGNLYVANRYQIRILDNAGRYIRDFVNTPFPISGRYRSIAFDNEENLYTWNAVDGILSKYDNGGNILFQTNHPIEYYSSSAVEGMTIGLDGSIFIAESNKNRISKFDSNGEFLYHFGVLKAPAALAVDPQGLILVADSENKRIAKFTSSGEFVAAITAPGESMPSFIKPTGLAVSKDGTIYIADVGTSTVHAIKNDGQIIYQVKLIGIRQHEILSIGLDDSGNAYVTATGSVTFQPDYGSLFRINFDGSQIELLNNVNPEEAISLDAFAVDNNGLYSYLSNGSKRQIEIYNAQGLKVWGFGKNGPGSTFNNPISNFTIGTDRTIYLMEDTTATEIKMYSPSGKFISTFETTLNGYYSRIKFGLDNYLYILSAGTVSKYTPDGKHVSSIQLSDYDYSFTLTDLAVDEKGDIYITQHKFGTSPLDYTFLLKKYAATGEFLFDFNLYHSHHYWDTKAQSVSVTKKGEVYVAGEIVEIFDTAGKPLGFVPYLANIVATSADGSTVLVAKKWSQQVMMYKGSAESIPSQLAGTVFHDLDLNAIKSENEKGMSNIIVQAEPGSFFGKTDAEGKYIIKVEGNGLYNVSQLLPRKVENIQIKQINPPNGASNNVEIIEKGSTVSDINFANQITLLPNLNVSVSSTRRRRCFDSTTKITYSNTGFALANNAKVYLQLPKEVELLTADKPYTRLPNGIYVFEAGTVAPGQTSVITIQDKVTCGDESVRGLTVCTKAWITPGNQSPTAPPAAVTTVTGKCNFATGNVRFVIKNTGTANMETGKQFRLYLDGQLSTLENYKLAAGDSLVLWIPTSGRTARLEADQPEGNGENVLASATVEACREVASRVAFSTGFVNSMPTDDEEAEVAEECLLINDSYDPNDKQVTPIGLTEENYTPTKTALKYKIRFQNTGTDVAYRVVVVDTLSEHLDLSTLEVGSASHSYRFDVSGKGRPVLTWTFDNIMLPDSTTNEPGSHGYIQFSIKPKVELAEKTAIENFADIFFDFNSPVRTNSTMNRIYDMPLEVSDEVKLKAEDVIATPSITGFSPAAGKYGAEVTLNGKRFSTTPADNKVYFNGIAATVVSASETEIKVLVPNTAVTGNLKLVTGDGAAQSSDAFEVYQPPVLTSFSPIEGVVGSTVTLQGQNLDQSLIKSIKLGNLECEVISSNGSSLVLKVPAQASAAKFNIETKGGEVISSTAYFVWKQPAISSLSKATDIVGATLEIYGGNFAAEAQRNKVYFGQAPAQVIVATQEKLTVKVPLNAASGYVKVETPGGTATSATYFDVIPAPIFVAMNPGIGTVGATVEIAGSHFGVLGVQDEITFNGTKAQVLEASETKYKVQVPRGATTGKIKVKGIGGEAQSVTDFVVEELSPSQAIEVYPNPTTGKFTLSFLHADFDVQEVKIYTSVGELVHTANLSKPRPEKLEINLERAKAGFYTLQIKTDRGVIIKKLTIL